MHFLVVFHANRTFRAFVSCSWVVFVVATFFWDVPLFY